MSSVEQFATFAKSIEKAPSPFREALPQPISEGQNVRHLGIRFLRDFLKLH